jgi:Holliday junction resolvase
LGLIRVEDSRIKPANPIYAEIIIRKLSFRVQDALQDPSYPYKMPRYLKNGGIDVDFLMSDFQQFWRENSEFWLKRLDYIEAVPHLVLMGFLQRIINGGGDVIREYASGTGCIDLCVKYKNQNYPIELKIRYGEKYVEKGLKDFAKHIDTLGCNEGWMVVFDRRSTLAWEDKIYMKKEIVNGKTITIVGA